MAHTQAEPQKRRAGAQKDRCRRVGGRSRVTSLDRSRLCLPQRERRSRFVHLTQRFGVLLLCRLKHARPHDSGDRCASSERDADNGECFRPGHRVLPQEQANHPVAVRAVRADWRITRRSLQLWLPADRIRLVVRGTSPSDQHRGPRGTPLPTPRQDAGRSRGA